MVNNNHLKQIAETMVFEFSNIFVCLDSQICLLLATIAESSDNATRVCQSNGTWANYSNYRSCVPLSSDFGGATPEYGVGISEDTTTIYFTGYTVSIVALTLAIWIFIHFKLVICFFLIKNN